MKIDGVHRRTIWRDDDGGVVIIDQTRLPHEVTFERLEDLEAAARAIEVMKVRGAPLIGATAAYGMALALAEDPNDQAMAKAYERLIRTRPTAVNLRWALDEMVAALKTVDGPDRAKAAFRKADAIVEADVGICEAIGNHGVALIRRIAADKPAGEPVRMLTHCNAGWLATIDWGTATAPVYRAQTQGIAVEVWVDETRPRNQGAALTAFELAEQGIDHTLVVDNVGGHLMQQGLVDLCIVGTDRTAANGDVANKIGTYLKALAAFDNQVPFYVALPSTTIDWSLASGRDIPIEQRSADEVRKLWGRTDDGRLETIDIAPSRTPCANYAFDVTPARLVTGLITERGVAEASTDGLRRLFPDQ